MALTVKRNETIIDIYTYIHTPLKESKRLTQSDWVEGSRRGWFIGDIDFNYDSVERLLNLTLIVCLTSHKASSFPQIHYTRL